MEDKHAPKHAPRDVHTKIQTHSDYCIPDWKRLLDVIFKTADHEFAVCYVRHADTALVGNLENRNGHLGQTCTTREQPDIVSDRYTHRCTSLRKKEVDS